eukprot:TRINITY_DN5102_c0_g1_i1.p1 TRINITY_DN5102_c0_g1~~TRINITY_DN5102_c0_g1_i1.p1  ORF type:complete len:466 (-),score=227.92 TRINITY_DN5102_c0_g1_i1:61-1458(-)
MFKRLINTNFTQNFSKFQSLKSLRKSQTTFINRRNFSTNLFTPPPPPNSEALSPIWTHLSNIVVDRAEGSWIYGKDGSRTLDFTCGIGVTNAGHCHPKIVKAVQDQAAKLFHGQINIVYHQPAIDLANKLTEILPHNTFFFSNSGAEAIEGSIKLAKHATKRRGIITFQGSFHGRTHLTMAMSNSKTVYRVGYQPLVSDIAVAPFTYCSHCPQKTNSNCKDKCCNFAVDQLEYLFKTQMAPQDVAAIVFEPVLGEGGYIPASHDFIHYLRNICDKHGILLIADEVQTGFARTGKMFAMEHYGVKPDVTVFAKAIANGLPLSGLGADKGLMQNWVPGSHGGTYGGNAVSCAAALATIGVIQEENLAARAENLGTKLKQSLNQLKTRFPIDDVRGLGLMVGVEFNKNVGYGTASAISKACLKHGMLILTAGCYETIRFIPALTISESDLETGIQIFTKACEDVFEKN